MIFFVHGELDVHYCFPSVPNEKVETSKSIRESAKIDKKELMTETLAKVYLEQKKTVKFGMMGFLLFLLGGFLVII